MSGPDDGLAVEVRADRATIDSIQRAHQLAAGGGVAKVLARPGPDTLLLEHRVGAPAGTLGAGPDAEHVRAEAEHLLGRVHAVGAVRAVADDDSLVTVEGQPWVGLLRMAQDDHDLANDALDPGASVPGPGKPGRHRSAIIASVLAATAMVGVVLLGTGRRGPPSSAPTVPSTEVATSAPRPGPTLVQPGTVARCPEGSRPTTGETGWADPDRSGCEHPVEARPPMVTVGPALYGIPAAHHILVADWTCAGHTVPLSVSVSGRLDLYGGWPGSGPGQPVYTTELGPVAGIGVDDSGPCPVLVVEGTDGRSRSIDLPLAFNEAGGRPRWPAADPGG